MSATFAALTAIFAKVGVAEISPDAATPMRTVVILVMLTGVVAVTPVSCARAGLGAHVRVPDPLGIGDRGFLVVLFSCAAHR